MKRSCRTPRRDESTQVLALWGEADPWTPLNTGLHAGASLGQHLDTWELVVLPGTGHCPHDESPEDCHEGTVVAVLGGPVVVHS